MISTAASLPASIREPNHLTLVLGLLDHTVPVTLIVLWLWYIWHCHIKIIKMKKTEEMEEIQRSEEEKIRRKGCCRSGLSVMDYRAPDDHAKQSVNRRN
jgi:hypothetical protein